MRDGSDAFRQSSTSSARPLTSGPPPATAREPCSIKDAIDHSVSTLRHRHGPRRPDTNRRRTGANRPGLRKGGGREFLFMRSLRIGESRIAHSPGSTSAMVPRIKVETPLGSRRVCRALKGACWQPRAAWTRVPSPRGRFGTALRMAPMIASACSGSPMFQPRASWPNRSITARSSRLPWCLPRPGGEYRHLPVMVPRRRSSSSRTSWARSSEIG